MDEARRLGFDAEARRLAAIEGAIRAACPDQRIDFRVARERELARVRRTEPSALMLERERRWNAGRRA